MGPTTAERLPDFVVIGTMKSGTTTLYRWLDEQPGVRLPEVKEPNFFCDDEAFRRGTAGYAARFAGVPRDVLTGEASVRYTDPACSAASAARLGAVLPEARLVCVLRDPVSRLRSHYRHEVQRGRERRPLPEALAEPDNAYLRRSCYERALAPWAGGFPADRLHVECFERLFGSEEAWDSLLRFLGLPPAPRPATVHNVTAAKDAFTPSMLALWEKGLVPSVSRVPRPVRRLARRVLLRPPDANAALLATAAAPLPEDSLDVLRSQVEHLSALLPDLRPPWRLQP